MIATAAAPLIQTTWPERVSAHDAWTDGQVIEVEAPPRGVVRRVLAAKNQLVEKGDPLVQLDGRVELVAPVSGRILGLDVGPGDEVDRSRPVASILYSNDLWVLAHFDPDEFDCLQLGQHARVQIGMLVISGRVSGLIAPSDPVLIDLVGRNRTALRPGMDASVSVELE